MKRTRHHKLSQAASSNLLRTSTSQTHRFHAHGTSPCRHRHPQLWLGHPSGHPTRIAFDHLPHPSPCRFRPPTCHQCLPAHGLRPAPPTPAARPDGHCPPGPLHTSPWRISNAATLVASPSVERSRLNQPLLFTAAAIKKQHAAFYSASGHQLCFTPLRSPGPACSMLLQATARCPGRNPPRHLVASSWFPMFASMC
jgi:hypothetical protein